MPYQVNVFQNWVSSYKSWDELKAWLTSEAGGLLNVIEPSNSKYALVRYARNVSKMNGVPHARWCRSVIVDKESRIPVSISPPKSSELTDDSVGSAVVAEEFVEGTMMSIFHSGSDETPNVATRGRIGADKSFYETSPSFRSMLDDAMKAQSVTFGDILPSSGLHRFASVVLQHPMNRLVKNVVSPCIYVVHQGWVENDGTVYIEEDSSVFKKDLSVPTYSLESVRGAKSVKEWVAIQTQIRDFGWQGLVLKDRQGNRWRERSESYETVRRLRGNDSTSKECYTRLRKNKSLDQYLALYPSEKTSFYNLEGVLRKNTRNLYHFYIDTFGTRKVVFHELPWPYKHHVSVLHNYFKDVLRKDKKRVELDTVIRYVNSLNFLDTVNMLKEHRLEIVKKIVSEPVVDASPTDNDVPPSHAEVITPRLKAVET
uniref:Uncharacterized protein n=1 Tax=viral metagenome TaxID=1070528 RepID=A0A6C0HE09_9ZZZZ